MTPSSPAGDWRSEVTLWGRCGGVGGLRGEVRSFELQGCGGVKALAGVAGEGSEV